MMMSEVMMIKLSANRQTAEKNHSCETRKLNTSSSVDSLMNDSLYLKRMRFQNDFFFALWLAAFFSLFFITG